MSEGSKTMEIMRELGMRLGQPMIAVIGCGGAGCNIVNTIYWQCHGVHTVALNSDAKGLEKTSAHVKIGLGSDNGEECFGMHEVAERLTEASAQGIRSAIEGYDIVFVIAGLGGGAGSGAAPVVARIAREEGAVVFGIPVLPFSAEGNRRSIAMLVLEHLQGICHVTVPFDNDKLLGVCGSLSLSAAFEAIDRSAMRLIEKVCEHSSSYVSDLVDEFSMRYPSVEEVVESEHEMIVSEMPTDAAYATIAPSLEFPFDSCWDDSIFR